MKQRLFVDHIRIFARAGKGGDGSGHFHREKFNSKGGPDGGDGGRGGDVVFSVEENTDNLTTFLYKSRLLAEHGANGAAQLKTGKSGKPYIARVPPGTLIFRADEKMTGKLAQPERELELVADLTTAGERFILCTGGKGGRGNNHFKSAQNQVPDEQETGEPGVEGYFYLELRKIADAGLVGFPNAGKSTLLSALSAARPKIANYPFTTLQPMVGVLEFPGFSRGTIADIPGLIEGAHANVGLGHDFLRHIMRCRILLFVVDTAGSEAREPIEGPAEAAQGDQALRRGTRETSLAHHRQQARPAGGRREARAHPRPLPKTGDHRRLGCWRQGDRLPQGAPGRADRPPPGLGADMLVAAGEGCGDHDS